jgi:hypothetical protein
MIHLTKSGMTFSGSAEDVHQARAEFSQQHWIRFPKFLDPELCEIIQAQLAGNDFQEVAAEFYAEVTPSHNAAPFAMLMLLNNAALFKIIETITGCTRIGCFQGRIYRHLPGTHHHTDWHTDWNGTRLHALTVNLSTEAYQGGVLMIRGNTRPISTELTNTGFGDAILFRVDPNLAHCVSDVEGTAAKTALAGWFMSEPDFRTLLTESIARSKKMSQARLQD